MDGGGWECSAREFETAFAKETVFTPFFEVGFGKGCWNYRAPCVPSNHPLALPLFHLPPLNPLPIDHSMKLGPRKGEDAQARGHISITGVSGSE